MIYLSRKFFCLFFLITGPLLASEEIEMLSTTTYCPQKRLWSRPVKKICSKKKKLHTETIEDSLPLNHPITKALLNLFYEEYKMKNHATEINLGEITTSDENQLSINEREFAFLVEANPDITTLSTGWGGQFELNKELKTNRKLTSIDLGSTIITDESLNKLLYQSPLIWKIELGFCCKLTFEKVTFPKLIEWLGLSHTAITKKTLKKILNQLPYLAFVQLSGCNDLPQELRADYTTLQAVQELRNKLEKK